ncbi:MAG: LysR family transcriptional regulator [Aquincola sp.]|nr:LysR family transcriptional regulator [Aquincola sp.]
MKINSRRPAKPDSVTEGDTSAQHRARLGWTDFHTVLTVARLGRLAAASEVLAVTHATLLRHLASIESRLGARLFDRQRGRYTLTPTGEEIAGAAAEMEPLAIAAERRVAGSDLRPSGEVRVAAASIVVEQLLPSVLAQFAQSFPDVQIEFTTTRDHVSLSRREADVALRITDSVADWLVGRRLGSLDFRVYGPRGNAVVTRKQPLESLLQRRQWIGFERDARELKFDRWLAAQVPDRNVVMRVDNFSHALVMVQAGVGIALLPTFVEATCPQLQPLSETIAALRTPLWLVTHQELRQAARIKVLMQAIGPALEHVLDSP